MCQTNMLIVQILLLAVALNAKLREVESVTSIHETEDLNIEGYISKGQLSSTCGVVLLKQKSVDFKPFRRPMYIYTITEEYNDLRNLKLTGECNTVVMLGIPDTERLSRLDGFVDQNFWRINLVLVFPIQPFYVDKLKSLPWEKIWHKNVIIIDSDGKIALKHKVRNCMFEDPTCLLKKTSLTVGYTHAAPYLVVQNWTYYLSNNIQYPTMNFNGIQEDHPKFDLLDGLEGRLLTYFVSEYKVNLTLIAPEDMTYGLTLESGLYTGKLGQLAREEVDAIVGIITGNYKRLKIGNYLSRLYNSKFALATRKPPVQTGWTALLRPFSTPVWIFLVGCLIFVGIQEWWIIKLYNSRLIKVPQKEKADTSLIAPELVELLIDQPMLHPPGGPAALVVGSWLIFVLIFQSTYSSNLTARLSVPDKEQQVQTLEDVWNLKKTLVVYRRGTVDLYLQSSTDPYVKLLLQHRTQYTVDIKDYTMFDDYNLVATTEKEFMKSKLVEANRNPSHYHFAKKPLIDVFCSWLISKRLRIGPALSMAILRAEATGLLSKWSKDPPKRKRNRTATGVIALHSENLQSALDHKDDNLTLANLKGIFLIWCIGMVLSFFIFLMELLIREIQKCTFAFKYLE